MVFSCLLKFQPESGCRRPRAAQYTGYHRLATTNLQHSDGLPPLFCGQICHENILGFCTLDSVLSESRPHKVNCVETENPKFRVRISSGSKVTAENLVALAVWASIFQTIFIVCFVFLTNSLLEIKWSKVERLNVNQHRSWWDGSLWTVSSGSTQKSIIIA